MVHSRYFLPESGDLDCYEMDHFEYGGMDALDGFIDAIDDIIQSEGFVPNDGTAKDTIVVRKLENPVTQRSNN